jgi:excisionase family DNA binding protein
MNVEHRFQKLLTATPDQLAKIDALLEGKSSAPEQVDARLLTLTAAAERMGLSRQTVFRMTRDGRLPVVEVRAGRLRVPALALQNLVRKAAALA